ncbi:MAG: Ig-like domain-containing protein [Patescibacteria group bacterium]|nr:Ig-like domain-containing protein [Patescibacteria group bacterium]
MRKYQDKKSGFILVATLLLLLAIPISVIGTQKVNDIRNRAAEETVLLQISTDLTRDDITHAYTEIPYIHQISIDGRYAEEANLRLGCDENICGDKCMNLSDTHPLDLIVDNPSKSIIWQNPETQDSVNSWTIVISAVAETGNEEKPYECDVKTFALTLHNKADKPNTAPVCQLILDNSNTDNIPQNSEIGFTLWGTDHDSGIAESKVEFTDENQSVETLEWTLDGEKVIVINKNNKPSLVYSPKETGTYTVEATMTDTNGEIATCKQSSGNKLNIVIPGDNGAPEFKTDPYTESNPGTSIDLGQSYSYTIEIEDPDGESPLEYYIINNTGWLSFTEEQNTEGNFKGTFSGIPEQAGSYTIVLSVNDGFHNHYSTQIWVINVNDPTNDIPQIEITLPPQGIILENNQDITVQWSVSDNNLVEKFDVYISADPSNRATWLPVATNLAYNYNSFIWNTGTHPNGEYYFVVEAFDNQDPAGVGHGISNPFTIGGATEVILPIPGSYPRITNLKPENDCTITENQPIISADLLASNGNTISEDNLSVTLNDTSIMDSVEIRGIGEADGSVIYTPEQPLSNGSHKIAVTFYDSSGQKAEKSWTFTIQSQDYDTSEDTQDDLINFLGLKLTKRTALVFGIGIILLILAVSIPWLFYAAWKRSDDSEWTPPEEDDDSNADTDRNWEPTLDTPPSSGTPAAIDAPSVTTQDQESLAPETPVVIDSSKPETDSSPEPEIAQVTSGPEQADVPTETDIPAEQISPNESKPDSQNNLPQPPQIPPIAH